MTKAGVMIGALSTVAVNGDPAAYDGAIANDGKELWEAATRAQ